ncbi:Fe-S-containing hydro-lyase [Clostridium botulinum]|uniref:Fumarate hydratase, class I n=1 Tax=Clostridium botulinum (strain Eklund 17B / Type B) TaxID=935198 RepID=B2TIM0_CLOBB|nr:MULTISPECIES: Fe-S-containing hydro-lyase [unclassified Clostridium]ACD24453.1 fumarate hydratase, class I [Clostridium botulinum B str. Eklund 17B (NRP)]MBN1053971.1 Fe-S-containing hydro-lyase [Clostridium botulinum]MBY6977488.1 Fe-S-containing hydro-lyase [Clostridium botulinum]MBY7001807.1 Fe-S-containing hydro-lyase [Clostridium botulinum]MCR1275417.1 Fe-S-containing hydro-lyase [Clostridium botulinum]
MEMKLHTPLTSEKILKLKAGDTVLLSGIIYSARDAAHKRLIELLDKDEKLPLSIDNEIIYYVGPSPAKPGSVIGSAGPTTSYRMDSYAPRLLDLGLKGMIGKGARNEKVIKSIRKNKAIYFGAIGGAAALIAKSIVKSEIIAYEDLGAEAIRKMEVKDMPLVVIIDSAGNNLYEIGQKDYLDTLK